MESKLTPKQKLFVQEYLIDLNVTQAAIRAGYSSKTAKGLGARFFQTGIKSAIEAALAERIKRTEVTQDYVIEGLKEVVERCLQRIAADEEGVWTFNATGANKALELLGKHLGMFKDRIEHTGINGAPLAPPVINIEFIGKKG